MRARRLLEYVRMRTSLAHVELVGQVATRQSVPQSLAFDGSSLWIGFQENKRIASVERDGRQRTQFSAPGEPIGATFVDGRFLYVLADDHDDRTIRSVDDQGNWGEDAFEVPDGAGSMLSWDTEWLWLSQHYLGRVHRLDPQTHQPVQTIEVGAKIFGHAWIHGWLYLSLWESSVHPAAVLARVSLLDPRDIQYLAYNEFPMVSLAYDGELIWTNDRKGRRVVALRVPA